MWATAAYSQIRDTTAPIQVTSHNFVLSGRIAPEKAQILVTDLEEFRVAVLDIFDGPEGVETEKIEISYFTDVDDFEAIAPSANISALYFQSVLGARILVNGQVLDHDISQIKRALFHEYMHHLNHNYLGYNIPVWLNEGLAEYYATFEKTADGHYIVGQNLDDYFDALDLGGWTPITVLFDALHEYPYVSGSRDRRTRRSQSYFYAQSWLIVHYFQNQPGGMEKLRQFIGKLDPLRNSEEAFMEIFGLDYVTFETELKSYMLDQDMESDILTPNREFEPVATQTTSLSTAQLLAERYLMSSLLNPYDDEDAFLVSSKAELSKTGENYAALQIANITNAIQTGEFDVAKAKTRNAKALFPSNAQIAFLDAIVTFGGITQFDRGSLQTVRSKLKRAIKNHPEKLQLRVYLVSTYPPDTSAGNAVVKEHLKYLINAGFEVRNPEFVTAMVPYLEAARHYDVTDRALNIAETWLPDAEGRSGAYRKRIELTFSRQK